MNEALNRTYPGKKLDEKTFKMIKPEFSELGHIASIQELAMFMSQVFYESAGLKYKEELACMHNPEKCTYVNNTGGQPGNYSFYYLPC